jgi:hypothetical protein
MSCQKAVGLGPHSYLLATKRFENRPGTQKPVVVVEHDGPVMAGRTDGPVSWVPNARAAGYAELTRRPKNQAYTIRGVSDQKAGPAPVAIA